MFWNRYTDTYYLPRVHTDPERHIGSWNFGSCGDQITVEELVKSFVQLLGINKCVCVESRDHKETSRLSLDSEKAKHYLVGRVKSQCPKC